MHERASIFGGAEDALAAFRDVGDPAALRRAGLFVGEGRLVVERLLEDRRFPIHSVLATATAATALSTVLDRHPDIPVFIRDSDALREITGFDFHRGCLALAHRIEPAMEIDRLTAAHRILAIEGVGNPDNIGGLFRSAQALGVDAVLLDATAADPLYRKAIRTSMGATLRLPYWRGEAWPASLDQLRSCGARVIALTPHPSAIALGAVQIERTTRLVLLVGSEGDGVTPQALERADLRVRIPIDPRADSLNVVVAASIALHALQDRW